MSWITQNSRLPYFYDIYNAAYNPKEAAAKDVLKTIKNKARAAGKALGRAASKVNKKSRSLGKSLLRAARRHGPGVVIGATLGSDLVFSHAFSKALESNAAHRKKMRDATENLNNEETGEKIARAAMFVENLANRNAPVTPKLVLASAALADSGTPGLEVMVDIIENVKTAEELDNTLDHVLDTHQEHGVEPDPALVAAIEYVLAKHGLIDDDYNVDDEDHVLINPKVAAAKDTLKSLKNKARSVGKAIGRAAAKIKGKAKRVARGIYRHNKPLISGLKRHGIGMAIGAPIGALTMSKSLDAIKEHAIREHNQNTQEEEE
jgi:hypothetical protein